MTDTPPSGPSAAPSPHAPGSGLPPSNVRLGPHNDQNRIIRKRNRIPLSCGPCRQRKLKCNRSVPCDNCVKRSDGASCHYAAPNARRKAGARSSLPLNPDDMQDRINRLEALVLNLVQDAGQAQAEAAGVAGGAPSPMSQVSAARSMITPGTTQELTPSSTTEGDVMDGGPPGLDSETERVANSLGVLHVNQNKSVYIGNTHWAAVLDDIQEVKNFFVEHKKQYEEQIQKVRDANGNIGGAFGPVFMLNAGPQPNFIDLINSLPVRESVDKLVEHYFEHYDKIIHIFHKPSWQRLYEHHWMNPNVTDAAYLAQLFAMMGISLQNYKRGGSEPPEYRGRSDALSAHYRHLTVQCLALVDYAKPSLYVLEALILHSWSEWQKSKETDTGVWVLQAVIVRLAMKMGLHRDPRHFSGNVSPFLGEMRRRIWAWIQMSDTLFSQQAGMPSMVRVHDCDTNLPSNIFDADFDENTVVLPDSKPPNQLTEVTYMIAKSTIARTLSAVLELNSRLEPTEVDQVMKLDAELQSIYQQMPEQLHVHEDYVLDQLGSTKMRYSLAVLYHKSTCVLHREFLAKSRENERYRENRRRCIDSAIKLLRYQAIFYFEGRPGGRIPGLGLFDVAISSNDFLLAATILSLDLWYSAQANSAGRPSEDIAIWGRDRVQEVKDALNNSRGIWHEQRNTSLEAYKASEIIALMLGKVETLEAGSGQQGASSHGYPYPPQGIKHETYGTNQDEEKPEHTAAMTLGMLSTGMGQNPQQQSPTAYQGQYPTPSSANQTPSDLAAAAAQAAGFGGPGPGSGDIQPSNTAQYTDLFQSNIPPVNIDWSMWDSMLASNNLDAMGGQSAGGAELWSAVPGPGSLEQANLDLPQQPQQLDTNLFANAPGMFPPGTTM